MRLRVARIIAVVTTMFAGGEVRAMPRTAARTDAVPMRVAFVMKAGLDSPPLLHVLQVISAESGCFMR